MSDASVRWLVAIAGASLALAFAALAAIGGVRAYTPVPFWDMWSGYLDFYMRFTDGAFGALYEFHNEHRLVLAKLFFHVDLKYFEGRGVFLTVFNYLFALFGFALMVRILHEFRDETPGREVPVAVPFVLFCLLFSWIQEANFTWAFQSQFHMAQWLPLVAFYLLHRSVADPRHSGRNFAASCLVGVLSLGTMANGILCLPLLVLQAFVLRQPARRVGVLLALAGLGAGLYLAGYTTPSHHTGVLQALSTDPLAFVRFVLLYIGGPAYYAGNFHSVPLGLIAGAALSLLICIVVLDLLRTRESRSIKSMLCVWLLFFIGGAVATAGGRVNEGIEYAVSSRYMTPVLIAWAVVLILVLHRYQRGARRVPLQGAPLLLLPLLLLAPQLNALESRDKVNFERMMAALALELGAGDYNQVLTVYPRLPEVLEIARRARVRDLSVFGLSPIRDASERLGRVHAVDGLPECVGHLDAAVRLPRDPGFIQLIGWMYDPQALGAPVALDIVDHEDRVVGHGLSGDLREDLVPLISPFARMSGFKAYALAAHHDEPLTAVAVDGACRLALGVADQRMVVVE